MMLFDKNMKEEDLYPVISQLSGNNNRVDSEEETDVKENMSEIVQSSEDFEDSLKQEDEDVSNMEGVNILGPETKINIYAGTNENADLSNLAIRPFPLNRFAAIPTNKDWHTEATDRHKILDRVSKILERSNLVGSNDSNPIQVNSVENLFQALKVLYGADEYFETVGDNDEFRLSKEGKQIFLNILRATPARAKRLGRTVKGLNSNVWNADSSTLMKAIIQVSFGSNPQAIQRLLATGNATLTHKQDRGKWGTEFPKLLMEVRNELREHQPVQQNLTQNNNVSSDDSELLISSTDNDNAEALDQTFHLEDLMIEDDALVKESEKPTE
jgi:predicted NAD-dependent protein-ADP-ribosyltransferase YbiA (DUF1768 family)